MDWLPPAFFALLIVGLTIWQFWPAKPPWKKDPAEAEAEKAEAYFKAMFPDLQPWYHPKNLVQFVAARQQRGPVAEPQEWAEPPGLGVAAARLALDKGREQVRLCDAAGTLLSEFVYEAQDSGGILRLGQGKLTVDLSDARNQRVRYWHPEREFKWAQKGGWRFTTRVADQPFDSGDGGTRWSSDSGSSASTAAHTAGAAGLVAAGGAFAGAGASSGWDPATASSTDSADPADSAGSSDSTSSDGAASATAY